MDIMQFTVLAESNPSVLGKLDEYAIIIGTIGSVVVMVGGPLLVFLRLRAKDQGFGPNSIRTIGIFLFIPTLLIVSIMRKFQPETLAALLGTVAGYVLSHIKQNAD